jgi:hypothetical protein
MTNYNKRVFEMLVRVQVFRNEHPDLINNDPTLTRLFQQIDEALKQIGTHATLQASGKARVVVSAEERTSARDELRKLLENLCRTAAGIGLKQFFMPSDRSDRAMANAARAFIATAGPFKNEFAASHLPENILDRIQEGAEKIERIIQEQAAGKGAHMTASTAISQAQARARAALAKLDPIMENLLSANEPVKAAWTSARRTEKAPSPRKSAKTEPAASDKAA